MRMWRAEPQSPQKISELIPHDCKTIAEALPSGLTGAQQANLLPVRSIPLMSNPSRRRDVMSCLIYAL